MACSCGSKKSGGVPTYTVVIPGGEPVSYSSPEAASAKAATIPGAYVVPANQPVG